MGSCLWSDKSVLLVFWHLVNLVSGQEELFFPAVMHEQFIQCPLLLPEPQGLSAVFKACNANTFSQAIHPNSLPDQHCSCLPFILHHVTWLLFANLMWATLKTCHILKLVCIPCLYVTLTVRMWDGHKRQPFKVLSVQHALTNYLTLHPTTRRVHKCYPSKEAQAWTSCTAEWVGPVVCTWDGVQQTAVYLWAVTASLVHSHSEH